jgi:hypothetical protein
MSWICDLRVAVMSDKKLDEELLAMFANTKMQNQQCYLARGRAFQAEEIETLSSKWLIQINAWADDTPDFERQLMDDIEAELNLRGIDAPVEQARAATEKLRAKARAVGNRWKSNPEEHALAEELLQTELAKNPAIGDRQKLTRNRQRLAARRSG